MNHMLQSNGAHSVEKARHMKDNRSSQSPTLDILYLQDQPTTTHHNQDLSAN